jgi:hypothetical protein
MKTDNSSFERVEGFKYFGTTLTNQEQIKSKLMSGNDCCHLVQNLLSSGFLSKNLKIKIHKTIILPFVLYGCETWSLTFKEEHRLRVLRIFVPKRDKETGECENYIMRCLIICTPHPLLCK